MFLGHLAPPGGHHFEDHGSTVSRMSTSTPSTTGLLVSTVNGCHCIVHP